MKENYIDTNPDEPIDFSGTTTWATVDEERNVESGEGLDLKDYEFEVYDLSEDMKTYAPSNGLWLTDAKTELIWDGFTISVRNKFNWFQKKMWKIFFGAEIKIL